MPGPRRWNVRRWPTNKNDDVATYVATLCMDRQRGERALYVTFYYNMYRTAELLGTLSRYVVATVPQPLSLALCCLLHLETTKAQCGNWHARVGAFYVSTECRTA